MADKLDSILKSYVADGTATKDKLLGAAFVVVSKDGPIYQGAAGRTRVDPAPAPFTPSSVTWLSSASKLMTALTVMHLVERGAGRARLTLDGGPARARARAGGAAGAAGVHGRRGRGRRERRERRERGRAAGAGAERGGGDAAAAADAHGGAGDRHCRSGAGAVVALGRADGRRELLHGRGVVDAVQVPAPGEGWYYGTGPDWAGLYSSAADYGRVMQELLRALAGEEGTVVRRETAQEMFRPQLDDKQREWLSAIVWTSGSAAEVPRGSRIDHGLGGILVLEDVEGRRRKGTMFFSGMCNTRWWIDPETGIGAVMLVNVFPYGDSAALALFDELERAVYGDLVPAWEASK